MFPRRLVGLWTSEPYDYGVMESSDLALLSDGRGWSRWESASGGLRVGRLMWHQPEPGVVELRYTLSLAGTWGESEQLSIDDQHLDDEVIRTGYTELMDSTPLMPEQFPALRFIEAVEFRRSFGLHRRQVAITDDPTHNLVPYR